jgi:phage portal protein BeeE
VKRNQEEEYSTADKKEVEDLQAFIYNCGRLQGTPDEDKIVFNEFIKMIVRDSLTFGNVAIEKIKTRKGALHRFRPIPAESVYHINPNAPRNQIEDHVRAVKQTYLPTSDNDPKKHQQINDQSLDYYKYAQVSYDNRTLAVFGDEDMVFRLLNPQNFSDGSGYCYSIVEMCIISITNHMNTEQYNSNFFTHGQAAKGILHLKGTVTQSQMTAFRRQFYNLINGSQNAWRTPIVSGLDDVQWVPMAGGSKEMEYLNYNMHLMRAICSQFQIDPMELGLDLLVTGGRAANMQGHEAKIEFSREKGLYPILMFIEDIINRDIIPAIDPIYG